MADIKRPKYQSLPFIVDGVVRIEKCVTKQTTCCDVIAKLPTLPSPLAVFLSVDGEMKELPGKTKLLKAWRTARSAKNVEFVIKKSENAAMKTKGDIRKLLGERKQRNKQNINSDHEQKKIPRDTLKKVSDLAVYVRYQQMKVNKRQTEEKQRNHSTPKCKMMKRMTSRVSTNSMDAFLEKTDLDAMAGFLSFCEQVTKAKLRGKVKKKSNEANVTVVCNARADSSTVSNNTTIERKTADRSVIYTELKSTKLGLKNKFGSQPKEDKRTSTSTIGSTDTGYHSVGSTGGSSNQVGSQSASINKSSYLHSLVADDGLEFQRHSTPVNKGGQKRSSEDMLDSTITEEKLNTFNDTYTNEGKSFIFEKFMTNHTFDASEQPTLSSDQTPVSWVTKRQRVEKEDDGFPTMKEKCRFLWNKYCDSDSDSESEADDMLDKAFISFEQPRKLRRESAISNLNSLQVRHSLPASRVTPAYDVTSDFNYSFNCSFPRMDESQSVDFSVDYSFSESEASGYHGDEDGSAVDDSLDSFMNSFVDDSIHNTAFECST